MLCCQWLRFKSISVRCAFDQVFEAQRELLQSAKNDVQSAAALVRGINITYKIATSQLYGLFWLLFLCDVQKVWDYSLPIYVTKCPQIGKHIISYKILRFCTRHSSDWFGMSLVLPLIGLELATYRHNDISKTVLSAKMSIFGDTSD